MAKAKKQAAPSAGEQEGIPAAAASTGGGKLQRHALSEKFSLPSTDEERLALGSDIKVNGQQYEIILYEGQVLDGWERYMSCLQQGITPKFKEYTGENPAAVAFGTNVIRRKLNSVQKALYGAKYLLHAQGEGSRITQKEVAKLACCSLERLNQIVQLIRKADSDSDAAKCLSKLNTTSDITNAGLQQMLVDCGVVNPNERREVQPQQSAAPGATEPDDDGDDRHIEDLTAGADISSLLDDEFSDDDDDKPQTNRDDSAGKTTHSSGGRIGPDKRPKQTPASACAQSFKGLTEAERLDFVKFAWFTLRPAIEACVKSGRVEWPLLNVHADPSASAMLDMTAALAKAAGKGAKVIADGEAKTPAKRGAKAKGTATPAATADDV